MRLQPESKWEYMVRRAREDFEKLTEEQKDEMWRKQRESWVRANMPTGDPRFD